MIARSRRRWLPAAAALLAVALFAFATARSAVMQAEAGAWWASAPICDVHGSADAGHGAQGPCAFCAVAAHSPIQGLAEPLSLPGCVRWRPDVPNARPALRQPKPPAARARGPPSLA